MSSKIIFRFSAVLSGNDGVFVKFIIFDDLHHFRNSGSKITLRNSQELSGRNRILLIFIKFEYYKTRDFTDLRYTMYIEFDEFEENMVSEAQCQDLASSSLRHLVSKMMKITPGDCLMGWRRYREEVRCPVFGKLLRCLPRPREDRKVADALAGFDLEPISQGIQEAMEVVGVA